VGRLDYLGLMAEGDESFHVYDFNDITVELKFDAFKGEHDLFSWEVPDFETPWGISNEYFFDVESDDIDGESDLAKKAVKALKKGARAMPFTFLLDQLLTLQYGFVGDGFYLEIEYDFYYKRAECKEVWIGEDLYWDWDWTSTEVWNHEITVKTPHQAGVKVLNSSGLSHTLHLFKDLDPGIAKRMYDSAKRKAKEHSQ